MSDPGLPDRQAPHIAIVEIPAVGAFNHAPTLQLGQALQQPDVPIRLDGCLPARALLQSTSPGLVFAVVPHSLGATAPGVMPA